MIIYKTKSKEEMGRKAASIIAEQIKSKPNSVLGLATGSTPITTYHYLVEWFKNGDLDFSQIRTVNLDEYRGLPRSHEQSYYHFMHENLFNQINIKEENVHLPNGENMDSETECANYEALITKLGIDLQLLGIGHDGHIGFNEPDDHFPLKTHCVKLHNITIEANKRFFASKEEVPIEAYTMGIGTIMSAKTVLLLASGKDKAEIVKKAFYGPVTPEVPASILQMHPNFILVADEDALSLI